MGVASLFSLLTLHARSWLSVYSMTTSVEKTSVERRLLRGILFVAASPSRVPACRGRSSVMCVMEPKNGTQTNAGQEHQFLGLASGRDIICVEFLSSLRNVALFFQKALVITIWMLLFEMCLLLLPVSQDATKHFPLLWVWQRDRSTLLSFAF